MKHSFYRNVRLLILAPAGYQEYNTGDSKKYSSVFTETAGSEAKMEDWRLTNQKEYLYGKELIRAVFRETETNDHEHCVFCWFKLTNLEQGYCTLDRYHWICKTCFQDFREDFNWKIDQTNSEW